MTDTDRIEMLEEENRQLKRLLAIEPDHAMLAAFQKNLRVPSGSQCAILAALYNAGSRWLSLEVLDLVAPPKDIFAGRDTRTIRVQLCKLRQNLGRDAILTMHGRGYTLSARGVQLCRAALSGLMVAA